MSKTRLNKIFQLSIRDVKESLGPEDYEDALEIATPTQALILNSIASQILNEMVVD